MRGGTALRKEERCTTTAPARRHWPWGDTRPTAAAVACRVSSQPPRHLPANWRAEDFARCLHRTHPASVSSCLIALAPPMQRVRLRSNCLWRHATAACTVALRHRLCAYLSMGLFVPVKDNERAASDRDPVDAETAATNAKHLVRETATQNDNPASCLLRCPAGSSSALPQRRQEVLSRGASRVSVSSAVREPEDQ
jgi:hypothetical protein